MTRANKRIILVVMTAIVAVLGTISILPAIFAPAMFGPLESHGDVLTAAAVATVVSIPVVCAISVLLSWLLWHKRQDNAACTAVMAPPLAMLILFNVLLWLSY